MVRVIRCRTLGQENLLAGERAGYNIFLEKYQRRSVLRCGRSQVWSGEISSLERGDLKFGAGKSLFQIGQERVSFGSFLGRRRGKPEKKERR